MIPSNLVILSATDTTIGLLSNDTLLLDRIKQRPPGRPYLIALPSLKALLNRTRPPRLFRRMIRRSNRTTFIYPDGSSYRIVRTPRHLLLLERTGALYSTSANPSGASFDEEWARSVADLIIEPLGKPTPPSTLIKVGKKRIRRLR